ncbi:hypothetical protein JCM3774_001002 [Rhodotorula dairenensis]
MTTPPAYLLRDFDPRAVKVADLRGILLAHDIPYASNAKKSDLVAAYEKHVRPQAAHLLAELQAVRASDHGVLDGESQGSSLRELDTDYERDGDQEADERPTRARKKSKARTATTRTGASKGAKGKSKGKSKTTATDQSDATATDEDSVVEDAPPPAKKRSRKVARQQPVDAMDVDEPADLDYEEPVEYEAPLRDDYDTEEDEAPRVSPKKRKAKEGGPATPRLSEITAAARKGRLSLGTGGSDANFSDYNPFQSGGEDTPMRDPKRRKSSLGPARHHDEVVQETRLAARKSMPALSARAGSRAGPTSPKKHSSPARQRQSAHFEAPARSSEAPPVEDEPVYDEPIEVEPSPLQGPTHATASSSPPKRKSTTGRASLGSGTPIGVQYMVPATKVKTTPPQFAELLKQREAAASAGRVVGPAPRGRRSSSPVDSRSRQVERRTSISPEAVTKQRAIVLTPKAHSRFDWVAWSRVGRWILLGFSIAYVLWWREEKLAAGFCDTGSRSNALVASRRTSLAAGLPQLPASVLGVADRLHLRPTCTPCPQHSHCANGNFVGCTLDYVPRQSPLRLGGLLPIPPKCVPDTEKLMMVAMQASKASRLLRQRRGEVICKGMERMRRKEGNEEARVFGLQAEALLAALRSENERCGRPYDEDVLEEVNRLALRDLEAHGEVKVWRNGDEYWFATETAEMPMSCRVRLAAIRALKRHKAHIATVVAVVAVVLWARHKLRSRRTDAELVRHLVQVALRQLQQQERSHYADPVHVPFPHVVPSHLRDLILQDEHSPRRRAELWKQVEKIVEGNANVRVADVEQYGEEMRGWLWTGPSGRIEGGQVGGDSPEKPQMVEGAKVYPSLLQSPARG